jgi:hypothetical protein
MLILSTTRKTASRSWCHEEKDKMETNCQCTVKLLLKFTIDTQMFPNIECRLRCWFNVHSILHVSLVSVDKSTDLVLCSSDLSQCHKFNCCRPIFIWRWFYRLAAHFCIARVHFKISLEEMHHICRRWGAGRLLYPPSPEWELEFVKR